METSLPTKAVLHFSTVPLVLEAKLIRRFGQVLHRLKHDFWLRFCSDKGQDFGIPISSFASGAAIPIAANKPWVA